MKGGYFSYDETMLLSDIAYTLSLLFTYQDDVINLSFFLFLFTPKILFVM